MKKKIFALLAAFIIMLALPAVASAKVIDSGACGDNVTWTLDDSGTLTISGTGDMKLKQDAAGSVQPWDRESIKSVVVENGVTSITNDAFSKCTNLTNVYISNTVTIIDNFAFDGCTNLNTITIPYGVTVIGAYVFDECVKLSEVDISNSVKSIGDGAFYGCKSLESIKIPDSVTILGVEAFCDCSMLSRIELSDNLLDVGANVFEGTNFFNTETNWTNDSLYIGSYLIKVRDESITSYTVKNGTTVIGGAFDRLSELKTVNIPNGVKSISSYAFAYCEKLENIKIPDSVTYIGYSAFDSCANLRDLTIPNGVTYIGGSAFSNCANLKSLTISSNIEIIGAGAFESTPLNNISLPDKIIKIGANAFWGTDYYKDEKNWDNGILYIGKHLVAAFKCPEDITIKPETLTISSQAFNIIGAIKTVTIPNSVKYIGSRAFYGFDELSDVYYSGNKEEWKTINIDDHNESLFNATIHYNGESYEPIHIVEMTVTPHGNAYSVSAQTDYTGTAYAAVYDSSGGLLGIDISPFADGLAELAPYIPDNAASIKLFVWTNIFQPVTLAENITLIK